MFRSAALTCVAAAVLVGCGGDGSDAGGTSANTGTEPVSAADDQHRAELAVLTSSDLGSEWETYDLSQDPIVTDELNCFRLEDRDLDVTSQASGEVFSAGSPLTITAGKVMIRGGQVATSHVRLYETEQQAHTAFDRIVDSLPKDPLLNCLLTAETVRKGPKMRRVNGYYYPAGEYPKVAEEQWAQQYEILIEKKGGTVWLDVVLMREERALGFAFFSSVEIPQLLAPISDELVKNTTRIMGKRLAP
jgi:hypothetical protein